MAPVGLLNLKFLGKLSAEHEKMRYACSVLVSPGCHLQLFDEPEFNKDSHVAFVMSLYFLLI